MTALRYSARQLARNWQASSLCTQPACRHCSKCSQLRRAARQRSIGGKSKQKRLNETLNDLISAFIWIGIEYSSGEWRAYDDSTVTIAGWNSCKERTIKPFTDTDSMWQAMPDSSDSSQAIAYQPSTNTLSQFDKSSPFSFVCKRDCASNTFANDEKNRNLQRSSHRTSPFTLTTAPNMRPSMSSVHSRCALHKLW